MGLKMWCKTWKRKRGISFWQQVNSRVMCIHGLPIPIISLNLWQRPRSQRTSARLGTNVLLAAIDDQTAAVSIGHVHWVNGIKFDLTAIRQKTRAVGAALIIDGTQSIGALPFDVQAVQPDALVVAGYKWLMGPYSIGMAYYGEMFDQGSPIENNWINRQGADQFTGLTHYEDHFLPGAQRYEVGEHSNFILVPMLIAAIKQLLKWTPLGIQQYCEALCHDAIDTLRSEGYTVEASEGRASHLFGVYFNEKYNYGTNRTSAF